MSFNICKTSKVLNRRKSPKDFLLLGEKIESVEESKYLGEISRHKTKANNSSYLRDFLESRKKG